MDKKKRAGVRFNEELYINFIYNPNTETVDVYKNGILISSGGGGGVTPEQLYEILQGYVSKPELTDALGGYVTSVDLTTALSDYVTTTQLATALSNYITSGALQTILSDYATTQALSEAVANLATKAELEDYVQFTDYADDEYYGLIKTDSSMLIYLDENGNLKVGGRLGQTETDGLYYPLTIEPEEVTKNSFLLTEGTKVSVKNKRILALAAGANVNLKAGKEAGSTKFEISNTFGNRFICAIARNGYATINESTAGELMVHVTAVYLANDPDKTPLVPYSGASESRNNIIIETDAPLSETESISTLRLYGSMTFHSCLHIGQGNGTGGVADKGKLLQVGQSILALDGNNALIGNSIFTSTNRNIIVGGYHINTLIGACLTGTGHDTSNGSKDGITAHGNYSKIAEKTVFALGNGLNNTDRSNIFEVTDDDGVTGVIMKSPNGSEYKLKVDDTGAVSTELIS